MNRSGLANGRGKHTDAQRAKGQRRKLRLENLEVRNVLASMFDIAWLGTLSPQDNFSAAQGINDYGQVVGNSYVQDSNGIPTNEKAFLYTPGVGMVDLGAAGATGAFAWDINDSGRVTGLVHDGGSLASGGYWEWAAIWDNGVGHTIPGYGQPGMSSTATGVNDNGVVVGHSDVMNWSAPVPGSEAYVYDGTTLTFLGTLGGPWSYAMDINNSGYVAGFADTGENPNGGPGVYTSRYHAAIWGPDGSVVDLGTFGADSYAYKINASGQAVGSSIGTDGFYHAFLFDGARMIDIGTANTNTEALSINDAGQVVGDTVNWMHSTAFLYESGTTYDLNTLVNGLGSGQIMSAHDINNLGQIVGYGLHNGRYEAYVLTPAGAVIPPPPPAATNHVPVADAGGPYAIRDGRSLSLNASLSTDPDGDVLSYSWDVNGDGIFGDASGVAPTLTAADLHAMGVGGGGTYTVTVRVNDGHGGIAEAFADLSVAVAPSGPSPVISGPLDGFQGVSNQDRSFTVSVPEGAGAEFEYSIDWGDSTMDDFCAAAETTVSHQFQRAGEYIISVSATDADGQTGAAAMLSLIIGQAEQQGAVLAIGGTDADDVLMLAAGETAGAVITTFGTFATGQVFVYGGEGSDQVVVRGGEGPDAFGINTDSIASGSFFVQASSVESWTVDGMSGDDTFHINGEGLPVTLAGGDGADRFKVSAVGAVSGQVNGGPGSDILDYALFESPVTVNLQSDSATATGGIESIEGFVGSHLLLDTIVGADTVNTWQVYGDNNAGKIDAVQFSSFENWTGGAANDTFQLAGARYVSGKIDGGGGVNTLDYSAYTAGVSVDLGLEMATSVRGGIARFTVVIGGAGADTLTGDGRDNVLLGNAGNDLLSGGAGGNDVLVGGAGNDRLIGSNGRNILIGGLGADVLFGGGGEDILVGGTTNHDAKIAALTALMGEWSRTDQTYQQRVDHLMGKVAGGRNGTVYLKASTVKDDATADELTGLDGQDWFWAMAAEIADKSASERRN